LVSTSEAAIREEDGTTKVRCGDITRPVNESIEAIERALRDNDLLIEV